VKKYKPEENGVYPIWSKIYIPSWISWIILKWIFDGLTFLGAVGYLNKLLNQCLQ